MVDMKKLAIIFPGIGYHTDKPLLYYSKKIARENGYEIIDAIYGTLPSKVKGSKQKMLEAYQIALTNVTEQLAKVDFTVFDEILFISKSIGTAIAASYAAKYQIQARQIYYTPVEESFQAIGTEGIVFHGTGDDWARTEAIVSACEQRGLPLYLTEHANHSMETGKVSEDIRILQEIMKITEAYIQGETNETIYHIPYK